MPLSGGAGAFCMSGTQQTDCDDPLFPRVTSRVRRWRKVLLSE